MSYLGRIYYFFSPYTDAHERAVGMFFKKLTERSRRSRVQTKLNGLLQQDIAAINLWTEYRYKGYSYLNKSERRKLYANLQLIAADFDAFYTQYTPSEANLIRALMKYFSPRRGVYQYRESSSFGRLLHDPHNEKLVGDCNQIVTLYIYLYSRYYSVHDLQVRELPEHVALFHNGVDIETTTGTFTDYSQRKHSRLLPVVEIVSINLLDTTDSYLTTHEVSAEDFLQASRFAYILSHQRDIASHNLKAAYGKVINSLMKRDNYKQALKFASYSRDKALIEVVSNNGAVYEMQRKNFAAARHFARQARKRDELTAASWQGEFFEEQKKLGSKLTIESIKANAGTIKRMQHYAKKSGNKKLIKYATSLAKHL